MMKQIYQYAKNAFSGFDSRVKNFFVLLENLILIQMLLVLYKLTSVEPGNIYATMTECVEAMKTLMFSMALSVGAVLLLGYDRKKQNCQ